MRDLLAGRGGQALPMSSPFRTRRKRTPVHWICGTPDGALPIARVAARLAVGSVAVAPTDVVQASVRSGDVVVLAGLSAAEIVTSAEAILSRGVDVLVAADDRPPLRKALATRWHGIAVVHLVAGRQSSRLDVVRRLRDIVFALSLGLGISPILLILAVLVRASSPGPIFFATKVMGKDGQRFTWRKFRSMRSGSHGDELRRRERYAAFIEPKQIDPRAPVDPNAEKKIVDINRVTPIGRFIRRHSLDELPQLWNVLTGDMTLVGPRPCLPYEYELQSPWHRLRFRVTPGLTGPWQAFGRSQVSFDEMVLMDYCYGRVSSFLLDARLLVRTALVVVTGEGGK